MLLSNDKQRPLEPDTLRQAEDGALYCEVRKERMVARFDRHAMSQLEELLDEDEQGVFVRLGDRRVRPPVVTDPLQPF